MERPCGARLRCFLNASVALMGYREEDLLDGQTFAWFRALVNRFRCFPLSMHRDFVFLDHGSQITDHRSQITDHGLKKDQSSKLAIAWHKRLHSRYETYCRERVESKVAATLEVYQLEETEWPIFGSCFFLWSTESLQSAWKADPSLSKVAPAVYARGAVEAATALVRDPNHAKWVRDHWGEDYLHHENAFYRMLYISAPAQSFPFLVKRYPKTLLFLRFLRRFQDATSGFHWRGFVARQYQTIDQWNCG
ncbi:MAG: hypothetical protein ACI9DF_000628 [Verrucomicrobiales bacterium]